MGRPKTLPSETIRATVRISPEDWESFDNLAKGMNTTKSELIRKIAQGEIPLGQIVSTEIRLLGKSSSAFN
ncbi:ribbon-helix-helix protein, CopG family [Nodularia chucula]|uniref:ribbon-helix-helix protein, CopG family n=1 Tax=Nodularia chucula TaxID=3093667 RepID=UPI0039C6E184